MKLFCSKCQKVFEAEEKTGSSKVKCPACGGEQEYPQTVPGPGVVVGDFLIEKLLSRGGMGEVFLAKQISLDRPVALKVLQQKHLEDKEYVDSLFKEARAAAKLSHPNIVQAYAVGEENGIFYFAMEYIRGETFKQILKKEKTIEFTRAATVVRDIARALGAAWREQKLVHQDIKPDNIMLDANGFAKLADLGLAKVATGGADESDDDDKVLGTPQYISPEQLTGVPTDIRSDIYSLGATFYHFVTGRFPYVAKTGDEIARMHIESTLQPPKEVNKELPDALNRIIVKMMEKDINKRYQSAEELIGDLDSYLRSAPSAAAKNAAKPVARPAAKPAFAKPVAPPKASIPKLAVPGPKVPPPVAAPAAPAPKAEPPVPPPETPDNAELIDELDGGSKRILKKVLITLLALLLLAVVLLAALVVCYKTKVLPQGSLNSFAGTVAGWFGMAEPGKGNAVAAKQEAPKAPSEYERVLALPVGSRSQKTEFHEQAAQLLAKGVPSDANERGNYLKLRKKFASADEALRFASFRQARRQEYDAVMERRKREREEALRLKAAREKAEREYKQQEQLRRQRLREAEEKMRRKEEERKKRVELASYNELKDDVERAEKLLVDAFYKAVDGDERAIDGAKEQAEGILYGRVGNNDRERKLIRDYRDFRDRLPKEVSGIRNFRNLMRNLKDKVYVRCKIGSEMYQVIALFADGSAEMENSQFRRVRIPADVLAGSRDFRDNFYISLKDKNPHVMFYYFLAVRRFDPSVMNKAPAGFWKTHIQKFVRASEDR